MFKKLLVIILFPLVVIARYFKAFLFLLLILVLVNGLKDNALPQGNLAELQLAGVIIDANEWVNQIQDMSEDEQIKGVLLVVDSPGGALSPSVELYEEIKRLNAKKPVIVYAQGALASGSYYASLGASHIVANKGAMVGSIGVIFDGMNVSELMQKLGIKPQVLKAGKYKEIGTITRAWEDYEKEELKELLFRQYDMFVRDVVAARGLSYENKDDFAEGRIFDASKALELGLIDALGTKSDAKEALVNMTGLKGQEVWRKPGEMERFLGRIGASLKTWIHTFMMWGVMNGN